MVCFCFGRMRPLFQQQYLKNYQRLRKKICQVAIYVQFGTQVKFRWSRDRNNRTADNAFSAPWIFSEMELGPAAG